ncbi:hypothetical protein LCGC14_0916160 [marine sediment metagenome]|uniref:Uncharacterized protein n=1 Tax=marine sediment metagenome TaxID=412755 RepID=A0A0F9NS87_9ZZZZ
MANKSDWSGADKYSVGVLAGCLYEKLANNIISLVGTAEQLLKWVEKSNPEAADLFRERIERARKELLSQDTD